MSTVRNTWASLGVGDIFRIGSLTQFDQQASNTPSYVVARIGTDGKVYYNIAVDGGAYPPEVGNFLRDGDGPVILVQRAQLAGR